VPNAYQLFRDQGGRSTSISGSVLLLKAHLTKEYIINAYL
jgi:hypothetical protein